MIVSVAGVPRTVDAGSFIDLTPVAVTVQPLPGGVALVFDGDLDDATRAAVVGRCQSADDNEDTFRAQAQAVLDECAVFLADPAPTAALTLTQVRLLTRVVVALIRLVGRRR